MKKYLSQLFKTPMLLVFLIICLIFAIPAVGQTAEINRYSIATVLGIDFDDETDEVLVSLLTFTPVAEQTFTENYKVVTAKGRSVSEALDFAGLNIGREIGLSHTKLVVLNKGLLDKDVSLYLDYLARNKFLGSETRLVVAESSTKDVLEAVQKLDSESSIKLSEVLSFNEDYIYASEASFQSFFKGMFGPTKVSLVPMISLRGEDEGLAVSGEATSSEDSNTDPNEGTKEIENNGKTVVFKDGKLNTILEGLDIKKINLINGNFSTGSVVLEHFSDENFDDAKLTFEILDKDIRSKVIFQNNIPIILMNGNCTVSLSEVQTKDGVVKKNVEFTGISDSVKNALEIKFKELISQGIEIMRDHKIDVIDFYTLMSNSNHKAFEKFLSTLEDKDDYLNSIVFKIGANIFTR